MDPEVAERVIEEGELIEGQEREVTVMILDIWDFTEFAQRSSARETVAFLNDMFGIVVPCVAQHGGHANKFLGDGLLAVFGAPDRLEDHADRALAAAGDIAEKLAERFGDEIRFGVGVNSGPVVVGSVGGGGRLEFAVIGDPVNIAARVENLTRETGDERARDRGDALPPLGGPVRARASRGLCAERRVGTCADLRAGAGSGRKFERAAEEPLKQKPDSADGRSVAPFHPVRYEARAFAARALAALAVFCTLAIVLLAGSAPGAAEAKQDKEWQGASEAVVQAEPEAAAPETHGNGVGNGGAGKWDPPDPVDPGDASAQLDSESGARPGAGPERRHRRRKGQ